MSDPQQPAAAGDAPVASPLLLKQAREAAGLHVAALAAALKVPVRKLEDLEAGRYDQLPDMTFARALASSACRHLRIDPAPVLAQLPAAARPVLGPSGTALNAPFQGGADPVPFNPAGWLSRPAVLGAIALLLGALVIVFLPKPDDAAAPLWGEAASPSVPGQQAASVPAPAPMVSATETPNAAAAPTVQADAGPSSPSTPVAAPAGADPAPVATPAAVPGTPAPAVAPVAATPAAAAPAAAPVMAIAANAQTWVEVTTPAGETVVRRLLTAGESMEVNRAPPYSVVIGRAEAARVTLRGQAFDLPPPSPNGVARFEVK